MRTIGKLSDRMLTALVPAREAAAACPPDCVNERQQSGGKCRYRSCCYRGNPCKYTCSAWSSWGSC